jgi:hypothetical protein
LFGRLLIRETHFSELAPYPIKYGSNYDIQRLALWFSDWAEPDESYLCVHHRVLERFTRQKSSTIPFSADPKRLVERLRETGSQFIFANLKEDVVKRYLLPAIAARSDQFEVVREEPFAILYFYTGDESGPNR